jgi:hypothetical protein
VLYDRARSVLVAQLPGVTPALSESDIARERSSLEEAIRKVETEVRTPTRRRARRLHHCRRCVRRRARTCRSRPLPRSLRSRRWRCGPLRSPAEPRRLPAPPVPELRWSRLRSRSSTEPSRASKPSRSVRPAAAPHATPNAYWRVHPPPTPAARVSRGVRAIPRRRDRLRAAWNRPRRRPSSTRPTQRSHRRRNRGSRRCRCASSRSGRW